MTRTDIAVLALTLMLLALLAVGTALALRRALINDGYGHQPAPRSRPEEQETRAQVLQRLG